MNWDRGFQRLSIAFWGVIFACVVAMNWNSDYPTWRENFAVAGVCAIGYTLLYVAIRWAIQGFRKD